MTNRNASPPRSNSQPPQQIAAPHAAPQRIKPYVRAVLMAMPFANDSAAARAFRAELAEIAGRGWAARDSGGLWQRTHIGAEAVGLTAGISGFMPAAEKPNRVGIFARVPEGMAAAIDQTAAAEGKTRNDEMLTLLTEALEARAAIAGKRTGTHR